MAQVLLNIDISLVNSGFTSTRGRRVYLEQHGAQFPSTRYHVIATAERPHAAVLNVLQRRQNDGMGWNYGRQLFMATKVAALTLGDRLVFFFHACA
jgi:hypothetical protein